jgi:hypothetical protein
MVASDAIADQSTGLRRGDLQAVAREHVDQLCALCRGFLCWEREEILKKDPSPEEREEHQRTLKWLLQATRMLHSLVAAPDFPDRSARRSLEGVIWQLEESWQAIYEPMPEAQANLLLAKIFPDGPRA